LEVSLNVEIKKLESGQVRLRIELSPEEVNEELERNYKKLQTQVSIPGFRKGRVPTGILKARFTDHIKLESIQNLVPPAYEEALISTQLIPLNNPDISPSLDKIEIAENQPLVFEATVDIKPDFILPDYEELVIDKNPENVSQDSVDEYIQHLQEQYATFTPIEAERPVQEGDYVQIDYKCSSNGQAVDSLSETDIDIQLGIGRLPPEVEAGIIGMTVNDSKSIPVDFDEASPHFTIAGKHVTYNVTLHAITQQQLPELDDEFAKDLGYESHDQLYGVIWNNLVEDEKSQIYYRQQQEVLQQLIEKTDIEIPEALVNDYVQKTLQNIQQQLEQDNKTAEEADVDMEKLPDDLRRDVIIQTKQSWLFDAIAERENIWITDEELDIEIRLVAEQQNLDAQKYVSQMKASNRLEEFRDQLRNQKIYRLLIERATSKQSLIIS
jgi:trigger factor